MPHIDGLSNRELFYILNGARPETLRRAYWAAKINDTGDPKQDWLSEARTKLDLRRGIVRNTDWTADVVHGGYCDRIRELWLFCPPNHLSPHGNTACIPIHEPHTAFQFKVGAFASNIAGSGCQRMRALLVGRVNDRASGDAIAFIWDEEADVMWEPWHCNLRNLGTWRESIAPPGTANCDEIGVKLL